MKSNRAATRLKRIYIIRMLKSECNIVWLIDYLLNVYRKEKIERFIVLILVCRSVNFTLLSERWLSWPWPDSSSTLPALSSLVRRAALLPVPVPPSAGGYMSVHQILGKSVLRIHDILVWIRIRMRIRILLFSSLTFKMPTKIKK